MSDPFIRIKLIKGGLLDKERPSFEELSAWIERVPSTWLPGLLIRVVFASLEKKVFVNNGEGLTKIVAQQIHRWKTGTQFLRDDNKDSH